MDADTEKKLPLYKTAVLKENKSHVGLILYCVKRKQFLCRLAFTLTVKWIEPHLLERFCL